jgi:hypothetical protein
MKQRKICSPEPGKGLRQVSGRFPGFAGTLVFLLVSAITPEALAQLIPGHLLVIDYEAGTNGSGALFSVDPSSGVRTVVSDFGNSGQGPLGVNPKGVAIEGTGTVLVIDENAGIDSRGCFRQYSRERSRWRNKCSWSDVPGRPIIRAADSHKRFRQCDSGTGRTKSARFCYRSFGRHPRHRLRWRNRRRRSAITAQSLDRQPYPGKRFWHWRGAARSFTDLRRNRCNGHCACDGLRSRNDSSVLYPAGWSAARLRSVVHRKRIRRYADAFERLW